MIKEQKKPKPPKDLGVKIGSENEAFWTGVKEAAEIQVDTAKKTIMLQSKVVEMAQKEIEKEKALNTSKE